MKTLHADDFAALNDEIRALTRAGVSLPVGLRAVSSEYAGRVGATSQQIADRIERGESLADAVIAECGLPPAYAAVVAAGIRSGRPAAALEGVATTSRRIAEMRHLILTSLVYPVLLVAMAYGLMVFLIADPDRVLVPDVYRAMGLGESPFAFYRTMRETVPYWVALPPLAVAALLGWVLFRLGRSGGFSLLGRRRGISNLIVSGRTTAFLELLTLLVEADNPLNESVRLAAAASEDPAIAAAGENLADRIEQGRQTGCDSVVSSEIPPMIQWLILSGCGKDRLLNCLRRNVDAYRRRTQRASEGMAIYLPVLLCCVIGGGATVAFGLFVLAPWFHMLMQLGASI